MISEVDGAAISLSPDACHVIVWGSGGLSETLCQGAASCQKGQGANGYVTALTYLKQPSADTLAALTAAPNVTKVSLVQPFWRTVYPCLDTKYTVLVSRPVQKRRNRECPWRRLPSSTK